VAQAWPKLILVEGIPGAGKSTTAHFLRRHLARNGIPVRWWYEEQVGHPLYVFDDLASLRQVVSDIYSGHHRRVVTAALARWRALAACLDHTEEVVVLDGCLLGYLTWTLFPAGVPHQEIEDYARRVAGIIRPARPCVVHLYERDTARALRRICERRGGATEERFIQRATHSPYGRRRGLQGFEGLVRYWEDYRALSAALLAAAELPVLTIESAAGAWPAYHRQITEYLGLPPPQEEAVPAASLAPLAGVYARGAGDGVQSCRVDLEGGSLFVTGLPCVWRHSRLIPVAPLTFEVESLPFRVHFEVDGSGAGRRLRAGGPSLFDGSPAGTFVRSVPPLPEGRGG
jgi:thymidylate kinase